MSFPEAQHKEKDHCQIFSWHVLFSIFYLKFSSLVFTLSLHRHLVIELLSILLPGTPQMLGVAWNCSHSLQETAHISALHRVCLPWKHFQEQEEREIWGWVWAQKARWFEPSSGPLYPHSRPFLRLLPPTYRNDRLLGNPNSINHLQRGKQFHGEEGSWPIQGQQTNWANPYSSAPWPHFFRMS